MILAIETSCDETAIAIISDQKKILAQCLSSQIKIHNQYGGVVPELASRIHCEVIHSLIEKALTEIRPYLQSDGGDISFLEVTPDMFVKVKLHGACKSCNVNQMTLTAGVEQTIKKYAPEVEGVVNIDA